MVAVIHTSSSLRAVLNYNEQKVNQQIAECLSANNYPKDVVDLNFNQKLNLLQKQASLNQRTKVNAVHISLNFDPAESLSKPQLTEIAEVYMERIGFADQPSLVYQHHDAGHPHIHILSTNIKADGSRISLHNLGKNQSEKARKEIETSFNLIKAQDNKQQLYTVKPATIKAEYGKSETRKTISNVLNAVLNEYKYTSLAELNAVLKQYNVMADRGSENSRTYQKNGLFYRVLDDKGNKVGVPIKASDFYQKSTLKYLQERFDANETNRQAFKGRVKNAIDFTFLRRSDVALASLSEALKKEGISIVLRANDQGLVYGITYVDHRTKCVFNGSDLGKNYSARSIQERCTKNENNVQIVGLNTHKTNQKEPLDRDFDKSKADAKINNYKVFSKEISDNQDSESLLDPVKTDGFMPHQFRQARRKKRKGISHQL